MHKDILIREGQSGFSVFKCDVGRSPDAAPSLQPTWWSDEAKIRNAVQIRSREGDKLQHEALNLMWTCSISMEKEKLYLQLQVQRAGIVDQVQPPGIVDLQTVDVGVGRR